MMDDDFAAAMRRAIRSVRHGDPAAATEIIQQALGIGGSAPENPVTSKLVTKPPASVPSVGTGRQSTTDARGRQPRRSPQSQSAGAGGNAEHAALLSDVLPMQPMVEASNTPAAHRRAKAPLPTGGQFLARSYACAHGSRDYRLYVPGRPVEAIKGLVVMLHGCTQDPEDFAAGTGMNALAEEHGLLVAYPGQLRRANVAGCWNWFDPAHQHRDAGEPAILAGITREIAAEYAIDAGRTFVAGLSAGGAMVAVMAMTYPELFAAVGIHSGLPYASARSAPSAYAAMRGSVTYQSNVSNAKEWPQLIVFHGAADSTVSPINAQQILDSAHAAFPAAHLHSETVVGADRKSAVHRLEQAGKTVAEVWIVDGLAHAWSGGTPNGTYTDTVGPDASAEMVRFFLAPQR